MLQVPSTRREHREDQDSCRSMAGHGSRERAVLGDDSNDDNPNSDNLDGHASFIQPRQLSFTTTQETYMLRTDAGHGVGRRMTAITENNGLPAHLPLHRVQSVAILPVVRSLTQQADRTGTWKKLSTVALTRVQLHPVAPS